MGIPNANLEDDLSDIFPYEKDHFNFYRKNQLNNCHFEARLLKQSWRCRHVSGISFIKYQADTSEILKNIGKLVKHLF